MIGIVRHKTNLKRGRAVIYGGQAFIGGVAAHDRTLDIQGQTLEALAKLDTILAEVGSDRTRLLRAEIWLKDISADFQGMNEVWDSWIDPEHAPARATSQCLLTAPDALIEIVVTAAV
jgi:enamine deaminase RidA (YjgF/YER057c/UK114 family)